MIDDAEESSTIYLKKDYQNPKGTFISFDSIIVNKPITIDGQGHTLDANQENRVFEIKADNIVLRNMTLINGKKGSFKHGDTIY